MTKDKQPATQDDTQESESEEQDPKAWEPGEEQYFVTPDEEGGSQEAPDAGVSGLASGSVRGAPEPESDGLDVPGSWRGVDEPGEVGAEEDVDSDGQED